MYARRQEGRVGVKASVGPINQAISSYERATEARISSMRAGSWCGPSTSRALYTGLDPDQRKAVFVRSAARVGGRDRDPQRASRRRGSRACSSTDAGRCSRAHFRIGRMPRRPTSGRRRRGDSGRSSMGKVEAARTGRRGHDPGLRPDRHRPRPGVRGRRRLSHPRAAPRRGALDPVRDGLGLARRGGQGPAPGGAGRTSATSPTATTSPRLSTAGDAKEKAEAMALEEALVADAPSPQHLIEELKTQDEARAKPRGLEESRVARGRSGKSAQELAADSSADRVPPARRELGEGREHEAAFSRRGCGRIGSARARRAPPRSRMSRSISRGPFRKVGVRPDGLLDALQPGSRRRGRALPGDRGDQRSRTAGCVAHTRPGPCGRKRTTARIGADARRFRRARARCGRGGRRRLEPSARRRAASRAGRLVDFVFLFFGLGRLLRLPRARRRRDRSPSGSAGPLHRTPEGSRRGWSRGASSGAAAAAPEAARRRTSRSSGWLRTWDRSPRACRGCRTSCGS